METVFNLKLITHKPKILSGIRTQWNLKACLGRGLSIKGPVAFVAVSTCLCVYVCKASAKKERKKKENDIYDVFNPSTLLLPSQHTTHRTTTDTHTPTSPLPDLSCIDILS